MGHACQFHGIWSMTFLRSWQSWCTSSRRTHKMNLSVPLLLHWSENTLASQSQVLLQDGATGIVTPKFKMGNFCTKLHRAGMAHVSINGNRKTKGHPDGAPSCKRPWRSEANVLPNGQNATIYEAIAEWPLMKWDKDHQIQLLKNKWWTKEIVEEQPSVKEYRTMVLFRIRTMVLKSSKKYITKSLYTFYNGINTIVLFIRCFCPLVCLLNYKRNAKIIRMYNISCSNK